jgi:hypothetical protein
MFQFQGALDKGRFANFVPANNSDAHMRKARLEVSLDIVRLLEEFLAPNCTERRSHTSNPTRGDETPESPPYVELSSSSTSVRPTLPPSIAVLDESSLYNPPGGAEFVRLCRPGR